ncbi:MAG: YkvA family protein [Chromatiales bacterium]|jgi:uncharacterized membrane protein YkvA (DUF1232 family)|nr:YkvA family protein [Chromatiales bacterium]
MSIKIELELDDNDLAYFRQIIDEKKLGQKDAEIRDVVEATRDLIRAARQASTPRYIMSMLEQLGPLVDMVTDSDWSLPADDIARVLHALAYFSDPEDLIPDDVPGIGYLDDAVMVELACRSLRPELEAYLDFCKFRDQESARRGGSGGNDSAVSRLDWLETRRKELQETMHKNRSLFARRRA